MAKFLEKRGEGLHHLAYTVEDIESRIAELAARLYRDYVDCPLCLLGVAEGAVRFVEALIVELAKYDISPEVHSIRVRGSRQATPASLPLHHDGCFRQWKINGGRSSLCAVLCDSNSFGCRTQTTIWSYARCR